MAYKQLDLFTGTYPNFKFKGEWKVIELFAGIGSTYKSLKILENAQNLGKKEFTIKHHKICEWAFNSMVMYNLMHVKDFTNYSEGKSKEELIQLVKGISTDYNKALTEQQLKRKPIEWLQEAYNTIVATNNLIDITQVKGRDLDFGEEDNVILSYSFPCQDISLAGTMGGADENSGTRSSLLYQVIRILRERIEEHLPLPKVLFMENVAALCNKLHLHNLQNLEQLLASMGYENRVTILNTKDYGLAQNRERTFMLSFLGEYTYEFPPKMELKHKLKDMLTKNVDEKYYLDEKTIERISKWNGYEDPLANAVDIDSNEDMSTLTTHCGKDSNSMKLIKIKNNTEKGYLEAQEGDGVDIGTRMEKHRGTVQKDSVQTILNTGGEERGVVVKKDES